MHTEKCKNCESTNIVHLKSYNGPSREFVEVKNIVGGIYTTKGAVSLSMSKYLCLDCEQIFEVVDKSSLNEYKEKMPYFI